MAILFNPATPIVREALKGNTKGLGSWQDTADLIHSYMWACFVALGGGEMVMVNSDWLRPVDDLRGECELLIRKASNWSEKGCSFINPTAARFSLVHSYRLLLHFGFVKEPIIIREKAALDLQDLISVP